MKATSFSVVERLLIKNRQIKLKGKINPLHLSGDGFASLAHLRIETHDDLEEYSRLNNVPKIIHAKSDLVEQLLRIQMFSTHKHILVAGNSDFNFKSVDLFSPSIFNKFYLQNSFISNNQNIFTLPIGIENLCKGVNGIPRNLTCDTNWSEKNLSVMVGPFSPTHAERLNILDQISNKNSMVTKYDEFVSPKQFARLMNQHRYVLCPQGNGVDTHRFWESLYRGCVPIILKSKWSLSLDYLNIPMIQLEKWQDLEFEVEKFEDSFHGFDPKKLSFLWLDYWQELFNLSG